MDPQKLEARRQFAGALLLLWLSLLFCGGLYFRFNQEKAESTQLTRVMKAAERLAVVARYSPDLPAELREQLEKAAEELEDNPLADRVIQGEAPADQDANLSPTYSLIAEELRATSPEVREELESLAAEGRTRLAVTSVLLTTLLLAGLGSFLSPRVETKPPDDPTDLSAAGVLGVFMAWDVLGFVGVGLVAGSLYEVLGRFAAIMVSQLALYGLLLVMLSRSKLRTGIQPFRKFTGSWVGKGYFLALASVLLVNTLMTSVWGISPQSENPILQLFIEAPAWQVAALGCLVVFIGPVFEEILFRGWLYGGLREKWGEAPAIILSSLLFAAIHGDTPGMPALFVLGLVFAWVYRRSGSLWASILVHSMWNATTFSFLIAIMP